MRLTFPSDAVVVVAGVPGAGKTTLIRRAVDRNAAGVVDTDDRREAGLCDAGWRGFLYAGHYLRIAAAILVRRPAVIHSRGTRPALRRLIALLAVLRGRSAHLVLLDAERAAAETGQQRRGRTVSRATMDREVAQWRRLMSGGPVRERWSTVTVLDRAQAAQLRSLEFAPARADWPRTDRRPRSPRWSSEARTARSGVHGFRALRAGASRSR